MDLTLVNDVPFTGKLTFEQEHRCYKDGLLHNENGPSVFTDNGWEEWYKDGLRHREGGPAITYPNGHMEWWFRGKLHREGDLPAIVSNSGEMKWYINGLLHRVNGPAITYKGREEWYKDGLRHRDNGPALIIRDEKIWYKHGKQQLVPGFASDMFMEVIDLVNSFEDAYMSVLDIKNGDKEYKVEFETASFYMYGDKPYTSDFKPTKIENRFDILEIFKYVWSGKVTGFFQDDKMITCKLMGRPLQVRVHWIH